VGLLDQAGGYYLPSRRLFGGSFVELGMVEVAAWELNTLLPPIETPFRADFGQPPLVRLAGYDLSSERAAPGETLRLELVWHSLTAEIPANYTVFVHLVGNDEGIAAQGDGVPVNGFRPTTGWRTDEVLVDEHLISIPAETAPGNYLLWVGFYDPLTDLRLEPILDGAAQPDGRLLLTEITIEP
jgi:hypothetical protein